MDKVLITGIDGHKSSMNFTIDTMYLDYSPYLSGAFDMASKLEENPIIIIEDIDLKVLSNYLSFLVGNDFTMGKEDELFFQFMGHPNVLKYPRPYWRVKLKSKWTRDNFYKYNLCDRDNGLYGLVELPIINHIDISKILYDGNRPVGKDEKIDTDIDKQGVVLAGGTSLWMSGYSTVINDLDFFSVNKDKSIKFMDGTSTSMPSIGENTYNDAVYIDIHSSISTATSSRTIKLSLIKRVYSCPSEVVNGFDLDVSQFVCVNRGGKNHLYATEIALYAATNKEQWLDPEMASTTYIQRLMKYYTRGIRPRLPLISQCNLAKTKYPIPLTNIIENIQTEINRDSHRSYYISSIVESSGLPTDMGSLLIMMSYYGMKSRKLFSHLRMLTKEWKRDSKKRESKYSRIMRDRDAPFGVLTVKSIEEMALGWIEVDPMQQSKLSGVFYPTSLTNLPKLYRKSPLYKWC